MKREISLITYPTPVPMMNDSKFVTIKLYNISFEDSPIFPTFTFSSSWDFFLGWMNFQSLQEIFIIFKISLQNKIETMNIEIIR